MGLKLCINGFFVAAPTSKWLPGYGCRLRLGGIGELSRQAI
jgi:hypothetical protein